MWASIWNRVGDAFAPISVALIGGPLMFYMNRLDRRFTRQHITSQNDREDIKTVVVERIDRLDEKIDLNSALLSQHLAYHVHTRKPTEVSAK